MSIRLVHIGLGKTATTTLQKIIFPKIANFLNIEYLSTDYTVTNKEEKPMPENFILSHEGYIGKDFQLYLFEKSFNFNKKIFDSNCHILITIRRPSDFLNSVYLQQIHDINLIEEKDFFINKKISELDQEDEKKYQLYNFNYNNLIDLYKSHFSKVTVVKYEHIKNLNFLDNIFQLNEELKKELIHDMKTSYHNRGISKFSYNLFFFLNKLINLRKYRNFIWSLLIKKESKHKVKRFIFSNFPFFFIKIYNKFIITFHPRYFCQKILDKIIVYKKYQMNFDKLPINIKELDEEYDRMSALITYSK